MDVHKWKISEVLDTVNQVLVKASQLVRVVQILTSGYEMEVLVGNIYRQVHFYSAILSELLSSMQLLSKQIVTPALLPYGELMRIIQLGISQYQLLPAMPTDHTSNYYELISVSLHNGIVYLHVPFCKGQKIYIMFSHIQASMKIILL